ncbi:MAG: CpaF family protein [Lachnospiraceae bacterium]|nr:CpaF family protein [Lachnospiraceae bacterium]
MREDLRRIRREIAERLDGSDYSDRMLLSQIDRALTEWGRDQRLSLKEKEACRKQLLDSFRGMDILQPLLEDEEVTEIMVNGPFSIFVEKGSEMIAWERHFTGREPLDDVIQGMAASVNRIVNTATPIADLRLEDGSRVNIVLPPVAPDGPVVTIRKFFKDPLTMEILLEKEALSQACADYLKSAVRCGCNIFISGGTGSGKTTFLNALSAFIPAEERVITIEDSLELQLQGLPNLVRLETRNPNLEGSGKISIRDLIRTALRMRPNRIVVGEVRGEEALDMLQAMNTGHAVLNSRSTFAKKEVKTCLMSLKMSQYGWLKKLRSSPISRLILLAGP